MALNKIPLVRKKVLESTVNIATERHQFKNNKNPQIRNTTMLRIWKGLQKEQKRPLQQPRNPCENRCHPEPSQPKGMTLEIRDAQGVTRKEEIQDGFHTKNS